MTDFNPTSKPEETSFVAPSAIPEQFQLSSAFTPRIPDTGGLRLPRLVHGDHFAPHIDDVKGIAFATLEGIDTYLLGDRYLTEIETGRPVFESVITDVRIPFTNEFIDIPILGINFNPLRPDIEKAPRTTAFVSFVELGNLGTTSVIRLIEDFSKREEPRVNAQGDDDHNILLANVLLVPLHDYNSTYVALGNPYIYDKSVEQPFHLTMSLLYGAMFTSRAVVLPLEAQRTRTSINTGLGCTDEQEADFTAGGFEQQLGKTCDEFQEENANALEWLTNSNDPPEQVEDNLSTPSLSAFESTGWSEKRFANALRNGEQIITTSAAIEAVQPKDGFGDTPIGAGTIIVALGIPAAQILIANESGDPLDAEGYAWVIVGIIIGGGQSLITDDPDIMLAYGDQDLLMTLGAILPGNYTIQYDSNASGQSSLSVIGIKGEIVGAGLLYGLGGFSFGAGLAKEDLTDWEKRGLWTMMVIGQGINIFNTAKFVEEGETRILTPFAIESAAYAGAATLGYFLPSDSPVTKFFAHNLEVGTYAGGPYVSINGKW